MTKPLRVVSVSYGGNAPLAEVLRPAVEEAGGNLTIVSEWELQDIVKKATADREYLEWLERTNIVIDNDQKTIILIR